MATCGYKDIAEFNRAELMVAPALQTEGKQLQRDQGVGMGSRAATALRRSSTPERVSNALATPRRREPSERRGRRRATRCWSSTSAASTRS